MSLKYSKKSPNINHYLLLDLGLIEVLKKYLFSILSQLFIKQYFFGFHACTLTIYF